MVVYVWHIEMYTERGEEQAAILDFIKKRIADNSVISVKVDFEPGSEDTNEKAMMEAARNG